MLTDMPLCVATRLINRNSNRQMSEAPEPQLSVTKTRRGQPDGSSTQQEYLLYVVRSSHSPRFEIFSLSSALSVPFQI
jgi:hypothetical protein